MNLDQILLINPNDLAPYNYKKRTQQFHLPKQYPDSGNKPKSKEEKIAALKKQEENDEMRRYYYLSFNIVFNMQIIY